MENDVEINTRLLLFRLQIHSCAGFLNSQFFELADRNFRNESARIRSVVYVSRLELPAFEYSNENARRSRNLFHGDGLREIPRLIHVAAAAHRDVIRKKLQRNDFKNRRE